MALGEVEAAVGAEEAEAAVSSRASQKPLPTAPPLQIGRVAQAARLNLRHFGCLSRREMRRMAPAVLFLLQLRSP